MNLECWEQKQESGRFNVSISVSQLTRIMRWKSGQEKQTLAGMVKTGPVVFPVWSAVQSDQLGSTRCSSPLTPAIIVIILWVERKYNEQRDTNSNYSEHLAPCTSITCYMYGRLVALNILVDMECRNALHAISKPLQ